MLRKVPLVKADEKPGVILAFIAVLTLSLNFVLQCYVLMQNKVEKDMLVSESVIESTIEQASSDFVAPYQELETNEMVDNSASSQRIERVAIYENVFQSVVAKSGDTLAAILREMGFDKRDAHLVSVAVSRVYKLYRIRPNSVVTVVSSSDIDYIVVDRAEIQIIKNGNNRYVAHRVPRVRSNPASFMPIFTYMPAHQDGSTKQHADKKVVVKKGANVHGKSVSISAKQVEVANALKKVKIEAMKNRLTQELIGKAKVMKVNLGDNDMNKGMPPDVAAEVMKIMNIVKKRANVFGNGGNIAEMKLVYIPKIVKIPAIANHRGQIEQLSFKQEAYSEKSEEIEMGELLHASFNFGEGREFLVYKHQSGADKYFYHDGHALSENSSNFKVPLSHSRITSKYGMRFHPVHRKKKMHNGIDYAAPKDANIFSSADGVIASIATDKGFGNYLKVKHANGRTTLYAHMSSFADGIYVGKKVQQGDLIGHVGKTGTATGYHLHFEIHDKGQRVDPMIYLQNKTRKLTGAHLSVFNDNRKIISKISSET